MKDAVGVGALGGADVGLGVCSWAMGVKKLKAPRWDPELGERSKNAPGDNQLSRSVALDGSLLPPSCIMGP